MEHQQRKEISTTARNFIRSAYRHGVSVLLIDRYLRESNWNCTTDIIHNILLDFGIDAIDYTCSLESLVWRRYLTNILETSGVSTYEQFEEVALQEAKDYYSVDQNIFAKYWNDFNQFTNELKLPLDPAWITRAIHYFGFTFSRLLKKLRKENISITPTELNNMYRAYTGGYHFSFEELGLNPKSEASLDLKDFWILSYKIGKEVDTIVEWTEIFTGTDVTENDVNFTLTNPPPFAIYPNANRA